MKKIVFGLIVVTLVGINIVVVDQSHQHNGSEYATIGGTGGASLNFNPDLGGESAFKKEIHKIGVHTGHVSPGFNVASEEINVPGTSFGSYSGTVVNAFVPIEE